MTPKTHEGAEENNYMQRSNDLKEMNKFSETQNLPRPDQKGTENLGE